MQQMIKLCNFYDESLQLQVNLEALPPMHDWASGETSMAICKPDKKLLVMDRIGSWLRDNGIFYCEGEFVRLKPGTRSCRQMVHRNLENLLQVLSKERDMRNDVMALHSQLSKMPEWALAGSFPSRQVAYNVLELEDCYVTQGRVPHNPGDPRFAVHDELEPGIFAVMKVPLRKDEVTRQKLLECCPKWWQVICNAFPLHVPQVDVYAVNLKNREDLCKLLAHSMMRQNQKDPVPFLVGASNSGKSSVVEPLIRLFGSTVKRVCHGSAFPLEDVPAARFLMLEELRINTLAENVLLQLLEHTTVVCNRKGKVAVSVDCEMGKVALNNFQLKFPPNRAQTQEALDNRFRYFEFNHPMPNLDTSARRHIGEVETPYVILYLYMVYQGIHHLA